MMYNDIYIIIYIILLFYNICMNKQITIKSVSASDAVESWSNYLSIFGSSPIGVLGLHDKGYSYEEIHKIFEEAVKTRSPLEISSLS